MDWPAIWLTARLAFVTSLLLLGIGLPLAYWLATTRWRGRIFVEAVVALPLVLPPTVLGFYVLMSLGPRSPLGRVFESLAGHPLPFSFLGLTIASVLYSLPFAVQPFTAAFRSINRGTRGRGGKCRRLAVSRVLADQHSARVARTARRDGTELCAHAG
jgi:molybdate transport system permease protein